MSKYGKKGGKMANYITEIQYNFKSDPIDIA